MADPNSIEPFKNEIEIRYLKASFERLDQRLGVHTETPQRLSRSFQRKLDALAFPPKKVGASWKAFWAAIVASFSLGMVLNFVVLRPATMTANITTSPATLTASNTSPPSVVEPFQPTKITYLAVKDPEGYATKVVQAAVKNHLEAAVTNTAKGLEVIVKGLKPNAKEQLALKKLLRVENQFGGSDDLILSQAPRR